MSVLNLLMQEMAVTEAWQRKGSAECNEKQAGWLKRKHLWLAFREYKVQVLFVMLHMLPMIQKNLMPPFQGSENCDSKLIGVGVTPCTKYMVSHLVTH